LKYIVGIEVAQGKGGTVRLSQKKYLQDVLARFNHSNCKPRGTPMDPSLHLDDPIMLSTPRSPEEVEEMNKVPYLSAVGSLMYLAVGTRPDIAYAVGVLSRYNAAPRQIHWQAVKRVFQYLKGTEDFALEYKPSATGVICRAFTDADYAGDQASARSTSGYAIFIGDNLVSWGSRRQEVVAKSTTEAEYIAANAGASALSWYRMWLRELGFPQKSASVIKMDNQSSIAVGKNPEHFSRMKHLNTKYHWLRDEVEHGEFALEYILTLDMVADGFTKALPGPLHRKFCMMLGLIRLGES
jgi:hypothetical protein